MLYGYKEMLDDRVASIVPAADSTVEYDAWVDGMKTLDPSDPSTPFNEIYASELLDHMMRDEFKGYKRPVLAVYHDDEDQRDAFFEQFGIKEVQTMAARDRQGDMIHNENVEAEEAAKDRQKKLAAAMGEEYHELTIAELAGVAEHDPWDKRTEHQKTEDAERKAMMDELRDSGLMSGDSFGSAADVRAAREKEREEKGLPPLSGSSGELKIDGITAKINPDGSIDLSDITAHKSGGPVDESLKKAREKTTDETIKEATGGFDLFSPDDFASVLGSDGPSEKIDAAKASEAERLEKNLEKERAAEAAAKEKADREAASKNTMLNAALHFTDEVEVKDLPEEIQKALEDFSGRKIIKVPVDYYPLSSQIDGSIVVPSGIMGQDDIPAIVATGGLITRGYVTIGSQVTAIFGIEAEGESYAIYRKVESVVGDRYMVLRIKRW